MKLGSLEWLIPIGCGVYVFLMARGILPHTKTPEQAEQAAQWRAKYGRLMTVLSPLLIIWGLANLVGVMPKTGSQPRELKIDPATGLPEGLTNHRQNAGTPDDDGWYYARSTDGCFSVNVPLPFVDQTLKKPADLGGAVNYAIQARSLDGLVFVVVEMTDDDDSSPEAFVKRTKSEDDVGSPRFHEFHGYRSVDKRSHHKLESRGYLRFVQLGPRHTIKMIFTYPMLMESEANEIATKFFDSLVIDDPKESKSQ